MPPFSFTPKWKFPCQTNREERLSGYSKGTGVKNYNALHQDGQLGIDTISVRVAQMIPALSLTNDVDASFHPAPTATIVSSEKDVEHILANMIYEVCRKHGIDVSGGSKTTAQFPAVESVSIEVLEKLRTSNPADWVGTLDGHRVVPLEVKVYRGKHQDLQNLSDDHKSCLFAQVLGQMVANCTRFAMVSTIGHTVFCRLAPLNASKSPCLQKSEDWRLHISDVVEWEDAGGNVMQTIYHFAKMIAQLPLDQVQLRYASLGWLVEVAASTSARVKTAPAGAGAIKARTKMRHRDASAKVSGAAMSATRRKRPEELEVARKVTSRVGRSVRIQRVNVQTPSRSSKKPQTDGDAMS